MAENTSAGNAGNELIGGQVEAIGGGFSCSAEELLALSNNLKQAYENLIDFTSYVIERVGG